MHTQQESQFARYIYRKSFSFSVKDKTSTYNSESGYILNEDIQGYGIHQQFINISENNLNIAFKIINDGLENLILFETNRSSYNKNSKKFKAYIEGINPKTNRYYSNFDLLDCEIR